MADVEKAEGDICPKHGPYSTPHCRECDLDIIANVESEEPTMPSEMVEVTPELVEAREAYLARHIDDRDEVMAGKRDWNGFIKGYLAALEASPVKELVEALEPFAKMADALLDIDQEIVITNESLRRTSDLPNYYLATRDLRRARALVSQYRGGKA